MKNYSNIRSNLNLLNFFKNTFQESKVQAVGLRVSDGRQKGNTVFVDLETFKLQIFVVNNTGLVLPMGTSSIISSVNLTYTTNAPDQSINLR